MRPSSPRPTVLPRFTRVAGVEALAIAAAAGFYVAFILRSAFTYGPRSYYVLIDDSMISMDYARNFSGGHGLVWQAGQYVEGYTNLLWTLWMALIHLLPFSEAKAGLPVMITGVAILVATMLIVRSICRTLVPDRPLVPVVAMVLVGLAYPLVFWTLRGMEAGLAALLLTLAVRLVLDIRAGPTDRRLLALALVLSAAVLVRDDMLIPAVVVVAFALRWLDPRLRRRAVALVGGALLVTLAGHFAFRLAYYGELLPNTYYLKLGGVPVSTRVHRGIVGIAYTMLTTLYLPLLLAGVALVSARRSPRFPQLLLLGALFATECVYSVYVGGDFIEQLQFANRFVVTGLPLLLVLAGIGLSDLSRYAWSTRERRAALAVGLVFVAAAAVLQGHGWGETSLLQIDGPVPYATTRVVVAVLAAGLLAYMVIGAARTRRWLPPALAAVLLLLTLVAMNYGAVRYWLKHGPADRADTRLEVARAVLVRDTSSPSTTVAVVAAGDWPYFSHRPAIDLLGKADPKIAHGPNQPVTFKPGHTKWDYDYSIGKLRPDLVTGLVFPTPRDLCNMATWGYRQIGPAFWVHAGARGVDVARLTAGLRAIDHRPLVAMPAGCPPNA